MFTVLVAQARAKALGADRALLEHWSKRTWRVVSPGVQGSEVDQLEWREWIDILSEDLTPLTIRRVTDARNNLKMAGYRLIRGPLPAGTVH